MYPIKILHHVLKFIGREVSPHMSETDFLNAESDFLNAESDFLNAETDFLNAESLPREASRPHLLRS